MEILEEKPKKRTWLYVVIGVLIVAIIIVYLVFFAPSASSGGIFSKIVSWIFGQTKDFSLLPADLKKDVTGGIINLKFDPATILENTIYKSLHSYADPVDIGSLGRPNPFIPF
jgi:hypothetical protein